MTEVRLESAGDGRAAVNGRLNFTTVPELWEAAETLFESKAETLEIDLSSVERTDSAGLALLVSWTARARAVEKSLRFIGAPEQVCTLAEANDICELLDLRCRTMERG